MDALHSQLDLNTAIFFLMTVTAMDGLIALLVWNGHRNIQGLATTAGGFLAFGVAVWMLPAQSIPLVTLRNTLFNASQAMAAEGMAQLLNKPRLRWLPWVVILFSIIFWPVAQLYIPAHESVQVRTIVSSLLSILLIGRMLWLMLLEQNQTRLLHYVTLINQALMLLTVLKRLSQAAVVPWSGADFYSTEQAWFYFLLCIESNFMFVCLLIMVGEKLSWQLRKRNDDLSLEVQWRIRLQTEVSAALDEQLRNRDERRRFMHVLGHEIGTPLAVIDRSAELIQNMPESAQKRIGTIRSAVRRLSRLSQDLLIAERYCMDDPQKQELDAQLLVREAIDLVEASGAVKELQLQAIDHPIRLYGDREMILLALTNVLNNAIKFSLQEILPILITLQDDAEWVTIRVEDSGIGFLDAELPSARQQYFRGSNATTIPGSGLGLYIVDQIVNNHGGRIEIGNRENGGAVVTLQLPSGRGKR